MSLHELLQESMFKSFLSLSILLSLPIPCQFSVFHGSRHPSIPGSSYGWAAATLAAGVGSCWSPWMLLGWIIPAFRDWNLLRADGWMWYFDLSKKKSPKFRQLKNLSQFWPADVVFLVLCRPPSQMWSSNSQTATPHHIFTPWAMTWAKLELLELIPQLSFWVILGCGYVISYVYYVYNIYNVTCMYA